MARFTALVHGGPLDGETWVGERAPRDGDSEYLERPEPYGCELKQVHCYRYSWNKRRWLFVRSVNRVDIEESRK